MKGYVAYKNNCLVKCTQGDKQVNLGDLTTYELNDLYRKLLNVKKFKEPKPGHIKQLNAIEGIMDYRRDMSMAKRLDNRLRSNNFIYKRATNTADKIANWVERSYK